MKLERGEVITLDDNKEYICFNSVSKNGETFVYLLSNFKPIKIKFAKEIFDNGELTLEIINDLEQKKNC